MKPIVVALKGKGLGGLIKRASAINKRYGVNTRKVAGYLVQFSEILERFSASGSFPVPAVVVERNPKLISELRLENLEFALHGYFHIDHSLLSLDRQIADFTRGKKMLEDSGIPVTGFRSPYLRHTAHTLEALRQVGFTYDGSQGYAWNVDGKYKNGANAAYQRALEFYGAVQASKYPVLPRLEKGLARLPYSLPDDESLVDRFLLDRPEPMIEIWQQILQDTYTRGEMFTLGLHPERINECKVALEEVILQARALNPCIWVARQDEIAQWWKERTSAKVQIHKEGPGNYHIKAQGPKDSNLLVRSVELMTPGQPWDGTYQTVLGNDARLRSEKRPVIGVSTASRGTLTHFLKQQGYISETANERGDYSIWLDCPQFEREDERAILKEIEESSAPLVRLGRWPHGARSVLSISGDVEGFTIWDYSLRLFKG